MKFVIEAYDHEEDSEDWEEFIAENFPVGLRVAVEAKGVFFYGNVEKIIT